MKGAKKMEILAILSNDSLATHKFESVEALADWLNGIDIYPRECRRLLLLVLQHPGTPLKKDSGNINYNGMYSFCKLEDIVEFVPIKRWVKSDYHVVGERRFKLITSDNGGNLVAHVENTAKEMEEHLNTVDPEGTYYHPSQNKKKALLFLGRSGEERMKDLDPYFEYTTKSLWVPKQ